jgi:DNA polymerase-3 subunit alpha
VTKKGERMMFLGLADFTGTTDIVIFPKVFEEFKSIIAVDNCVALKGRVSKRNGETSFVAEKLKLL